MDPADNLYINRDNLLVTKLGNDEYEVIAAHSCGFTFVKIKNNGSGKRLEKDS